MGIGMCLTTILLGQTKTDDELYAIWSNKSNPEIERIEAIWERFNFDSLLNKEFIGHPHSNKRDREWHKLFKKLNLKVEKKEYTKAYGFLQNATYYLQAK